MGCNNEEKNDINRLKEEADIETVINYLSIPIVRRGSAYFILCPNPAHDDTNPTNCYFKKGWNNVYCKACNTATNAIDLIMNTLHCSYGDACDRLWEIEGKPDWYYATRNNNAPKTRASFSLTRDELKLLGLHSPTRILCPVNESPTNTDLKGTEYAYDKRFPLEYIKCRIVSGSWYDYLSEEEFIALVKRKTKEKMDDLTETGRFIGCVKLAAKEIGIDMPNVFPRKQYKKLKALFDKCISFESEIEKEKKKSA